MSKEQFMGKSFLAGRLKADTAEVPKIVTSINDYRKWADPLLHDRYGKSRDGSTERLHLAIALLPVDERKLNYLRKHLLTVSHNQFPVIRDALVPHKEELIEGLWDDATNDEDADQRFQAACALTTYASKDERWDTISTSVADYLVQVRPSELGPWRNALRPAKGYLTDSLAEIYRNDKQGEQVRGFAADTLADYLSDDAEGLFDLLADANEKQFAPIFDKLAAHRGRAIELGNAEVTRTPTKDASEDDKEALAMRKANAAIMLLRLNASESVWPLLKHGPDPRVRSYITHWLSPRGGDPKMIIARYEHETNITIKRALLLCLGEFDESRLPKYQRMPLIETFLTVYKNDPDAGLHGAAEWLFTSPPLFTVMSGQKELGNVHESTFYKREEGPAILVLAGRSWKTRHLDRKRRIAHVEPTDEKGRSRWLGEGQMLNHEVCQSIRRILALDEDDPAWSRRAVQQFSEIRDEHPWVSLDATSLVHQPNGDIRWWTFAGGVANTLLAESLKSHCDVKSDNLALSFPTASSLEVVSEYTTLSSPRR